jgi:hypothetical protein
MSDLANLTFDSDELAILFDALEADLEDYTDAANEAREEGSTDQANELAGAALRVQAVLEKVRGASKELEL